MTQFSTGAGNPPAATPADSGLQTLGGTMLASLDLVLANPPFNLQAVEHVANILSRLEPGGRAHVLVPSGFLSARGDAQRLRRELVEQGQIEALVNLPGGLFRPHTHVAVSMLLLRKTGHAGAAVRVIDGKPLFPDANAAGCRRFEYVPPSDDLKRDANIKYVSAVDEQGQPQWQQCQAWYLTEAELSGNGWNLAQWWPTERVEFAWLQTPLGKALRALGQIGKLDRCARIFGGTKVPGAALSSEAQSGAVPYVRIQDMREGVAGRGEKWVSPDVLGKVAMERRLQAGDILLSKSGTIGKAALVGASMAGAVACGGIHVIRMTPAIRIPLDPEFLLAYLQCHECNAWLNSYANGSVIQGLRVGVLKKLILPLPPPGLQRAAVDLCKQTGADVLASLTTIMDER